MQFTTHVEPLGLGNIHPRLNEQFERALSEIRDAFVDESEHLSAEKRKATITIKLVFERNMEHRTDNVVATIETKLPGFRSTGQQIRLPRGGERFLVEVDDATQTDMFRPDPDEPESVQ